MSIFNSGQKVRCIAEGVYSFTNPGVICQVVSVVDSQNIVVKMFGFYETEQKYRKLSRIHQDWGNYEETARSISKGSQFIVESKHFERYEVDPSFISVNGIHIT